MHKSVVVIGNFDGVHLGHQTVIQTARERCDQIGSETGQRPNCVVVTFWPHPMTVVAPQAAPQLLMSLAERISYLQQVGADEVRVCQFTQDVAHWAPAEFVARVIRPLSPIAVVVGENFRFGNQAAGDVTLLREIGASEDLGPAFAVDTMELLRIDGEKTCSTLIRRLLQAGDVVAAAKHLGRPFRFRGVVVLGDQRGRQLGFPTANLVAKPDMVVPADGVYAGWLTQLTNPTHDLKTAVTPLPAAISVGTNPTFYGLDRRVETYVLDRNDLELYGAEIAVTFVAKVRGQVKFSGATQLVDQMNQDVAKIKQLLDADSPHKV